VECGRGVKACRTRLREGRRVARNGSFDCKRGEMERVQKGSRKVRGRWLAKRRRAGGQVVGRGEGVSRGGGSGGGREGAGEGGRVRRGGSRAEVGWMSVISLVRAS